MQRIAFVDKNKSLCKKVEKLFEEYKHTPRELDVYCGDVFKYKKQHPSFRICTASNPDFTMGGWLDLAIAKNYPEEVKLLKEFWITENLFGLVTVDRELKTNKLKIRRCLAGVYAYRYTIDVILTGIGTGIGELSEDDFLGELKRFLSANLSSANLSSADLSYANLSYADLSYADLSYANLSYANLRSADLNKVGYNESTCFFALQCPEEGDFIGWKKCREGKVVKLKIPAKAKRSSATSRKCRAEYAKVLEIFTTEWKTCKTAISSQDKEFKYEVWKTVKCDKWEENRWKECAGGIHFFLTRREAEQY